MYISIRNLRPLFAGLAFMGPALALAWPGSPYGYGPQYYNQGPMPYGSWGTPAPADNALPAMAPGYPESLGQSGLPPSVRVSSRWLRSWLLSLERAPEALLQSFDKGIRAERAAGAGMRVQQVGDVRRVRLADEAIPVGYQLQQRTHADEFVVRSAQMGPGARPRPVLRPCTEPRTDRIQLHIPGSGDEMPLIHHERVKTLLPKMPLPAFPDIDHARVATMRLAQRVTQTELIGRDQDQVHMIRHEAVDKNLRATRSTGRREQSPILGVVLVAKEGLLASITALGHMMRQPRDNHSWKSRHRSVNPSSQKPHFVF